MSWNRFNGYTELRCTVLFAKHAYSTPLIIIDGVWLHPFHLMETITWCTCMHSIENYTLHIIMTTRLVSGVFILHGQRFLHRPRSCNYMRTSEETYRSLSSVLFRVDSSLNCILVHVIWRAQTVRPSVCFISRGQTAAALSTVLVHALGG